MAGGVDVDGATTPLVGRGAELERIHDAVASAHAGRGRLLLLEGEAGIGKTRLVDEALDRAAALGMRTFRARAEELDSRRPFGAILACLGHPHLDRLAFGDAAAEPKLIDALVVHVEELCSQQPVAIAVDDLHWADPSTLQVFHRLARTVDRYPLLLCGAYRPVPHPPELARLLRGMAPQPATTLSLHPLPPAEVACLLSSVLGVAPGPRLTRQAALAGGNPFYVTELVAALRATGSLQTTAGEAEIGSVALPPALKLTVLLELSFLTAETQDMLRAAAVLGSSFAVHDLGLVLDRSAVGLAPAVREAVAARVLRDDGTRLSFRHDLLREAIYDDLPLSLRMGMHVHVAGVLARHGASPLDVAEHYVRGASRGDATALQWLLRAADDATVRAPAIAAELLDRAAELFDPADPGRDALLADRVVALETAARYDEAERACVELLRRPQPPAIEAKLRLCLARHLMRRKAEDGALDQVARVEAIEGLTPAQRARAFGVASTIPIATTRFDLAEDIARRGIALGAAAGEAVAEASCAFALAATSYHRGRFAEALDWLDRARVDTDRAPENRMGPGWRNLVQNSRLLRGQLCLRLDHPDDARTALRLARREAEADGYRGVLVSAQSLVVAHGVALGDWDDAIAEFNALLDLCAELDERPPHLQLGAGARALVAVHQGDPDAAVAALAFRADMESPHMSAVATLAQALLVESSGGAGPALDALAGAWDTSMQLGVTANCVVLGPDLVRLAVAAGDLDRARAACEEVETVVAANPSATTLHGSRLRCRGLLEDDAGSLVDAATVLGTGPRPLDHALACEDAADALARSGDGVAARRWFDEALTTYERLEARWDVSRAMARLRSAGVRRGSRRTRARPTEGWQSLTPGERAVVDLVADGLSNPDVAERLYLSRNTVKTHLGSAMRKLGLSSRVKLVRARPRPPG